MSNVSRNSALGAVLCLHLASAGCGQEEGHGYQDVDVGQESVADGIIVAAYLAAKPAIMNSHATWHRDNLKGLSDYGESFLGFHRKLIAEFDHWRMEQGYGPVPAWDPSTPIPKAAHHPGRRSDDPSSVDPLCRTPDWLKLDGAGARNRDFGAGRLAEFTSADQLGRAIDSALSPNWHTRVHTIIGGDLGTAQRFPLDPVFWRYHKFIDGIWRQWERATGNDATPTDP